jgi:CAAX protease family protein
MNDSSQVLRPWPTAVGLIVALGGAPALVATSRHVFGDSPTIGVQTMLQLIFCGFAAFVAFVVLRLERLPLRSIGLRRPGWPTVATALLLTASGFVLQLLVTAPLVKAFGQAGADAGVARLAVLPAWFRLFIGATGGVVEETLYRGYAIERLEAVTGRRWVGATLATVAFGAAHVPFWGIRFSFVADLPVGVILASFYLWRRDLLANMLAHSTWLIVALFATVPTAI